MNKSYAFALTVASLALAGVAQATFTCDPKCTSHLWEITKPNQNPGAGEVKSLTAANAANGTDFAWYANFGSQPNPNKTQGFWLVVSPGPNPKGHAGELAIFYLDASDYNAPKLSVYAYNGQNGDNSYKYGKNGQPADKILSSVNSTDWIKEIVAKENGDGTRTLGFRINPTAINNHSPKYPGSTPWTGAKFGDKIGVWFHPVAGLSTAYGQDGFLSKFAYNCQGWVDGENFRTQCVPEPGSFVAMGVAGALVLARKRFSKKA